MARKKTGKRLLTWVLVLVMALSLLPLNGGLTPEMVTAGSNRKVWWQCPLGHTWKAVVYSRAGSQRCGCPICAGNVSQKHRHLHLSPQPDAERRRA